MGLPQFSKFSPVTVLTKERIKSIRLDAGKSMNEGARLLGVSRKQLEDIETIRNYGCHIDLEILVKVSIVYSCTIDSIIGAVPIDGHVEYCERPRKRRGSSVRGDNASI